MKSWKRGVGAAAVALGLLGTPEAAPFVSNYKSYELASSESVDGIFSRYRYEKDGRALNVYTAYGQEVTEDQYLRMRAEYVRQRDEELKRREKEFNDQVEMIRKEFDARAEESRKRFVDQADTAR